MDRAGPSALDIALAGIALILIVVGVFVCFTVKWWLAFIPLGLAAVLVVYTLVMYFYRQIKEIEREENIL